MKVEFRTPEQTAVASDAERLLQSGADHEIVLAFLRERGFNKLDSIKALVGISGISLGDAKNVVHNSRAWQDVFTRDEEFHASLEKAVQALGLKESSH